LIGVTIRSLPICRAVINNFKRHFNSGTHGSREHHILNTRGSMLLPVLMGLTLLGSLIYTVNQTTQSSQQVSTKRNFESAHKNMKKTLERILSTEFACKTAIAGSVLNMRSIDGDYQENPNIRIKQPRIDPDDPRPGRTFIQRRTSFNGVVIENIDFIIQRRDAWPIFKVDLVVTSVSGADSNIESTFRIPIIARFAEGTPVDTGLHRIVSCVAEENFEEETTGPVIPEATYDRVLVFNSSETLHTMQPTAGVAQLNLEMAIATPTDWLGSQYEVTSLQTSFDLTDSSDTNIELKLAIEVCEDRRIVPGGNNTYVQWAQDAEVFLFLDNSIVESTVFSGKGASGPTSSRCHAGTLYLHHSADLSSGTHQVRVVAKRGQYSWNAFGNFLQTSIVYINKPIVVDPPGPTLVNLIPRSSISITAYPSASI